ncbi:MAG: hypothetical protein KDK78_08425, partial [Chlamydiia bacterium]|nr:hypothetical protein [Chlamydiia bacterium]
WEKGQKLSQEREGANVDKALQEAKSALAVAENTEIAKLVAATDALASQSTPRVVVQGGLRGALKQEAIPLLEDLLNATKWETLDARNALLRACAEGDTDGFDAVFDRLANAINEDQDIRKQFAELALDPGVVGLRTLLEDLFPTAEMNLSAFEEEFKRLLAAPPSGPAIPEELRGSVDALRSFNLERTEELKTLKKSKDDAQTKKAAEKEKIDELRQREKRSTDRLHATEKQLDRRAHRTALVEHLGRGANFKAKEEDIRARILTPTAFKNAESVRDGARTVNAYAGAGIPMELVCWPHINGDPKHSQLVARIDEALLHVEALKQLGRSEEAKAAASRLAKNIEQIQEEAKRYVQTLIAGHGGDLMRQRSGLDAWGAPTPPRESVAYHLRELKSYLESPSPKSAPLYPTEQGWTESLRSSKNTDSHPYTRQRINDVHRIQQALKAGREDFATLKAKELHLRLGQHGDLTGILERIQKWAESPMVDLPEGIQELPYPVGRSTLLVVSNPVNQETEDTDTDSDLDM